MKTKELLEIGYKKGLERAHEKGCQGELAEMCAREYAGGYIEGCEKVKAAYERCRAKGGDAKCATIASMSSSEPLKTT